MAGSASQGSSVPKDVSNAMVKLDKEQSGRGPTTAKASFGIAPVVHTFDPIDPSTPGVARKIAVAFALQRATDADTLAAIALCVTEAISNVVVHAYRDRESGAAVLECAAPDDGITITVSDDGSGLAPRVDSPGLGFGLPLIAQTATEAHFRTRPNGGLCVCMHFKAPT